MEALRFLASKERHDLAALLFREGYHGTGALERCKEKISSMKRRLAVDLAIEETLTLSGSREEENLEESEWQEGNEHPIVDQESMNLLVPKRRRSSSSARNRTQLEENEWRTKVEVLEVFEVLSEVTEQLEVLRGGITLDNLPLLAPCKCYLFKPANSESQTTYEDYVAQSPVQTFLRNVRLLRRSELQRIGDNHDEVQEHLATVADFVIELCCQTKPIYLKGRYAEAYVHHAVDFIKDTIPLLREGNEDKRVLADKLVVKLVLDLLGKLLNFTPDVNSTLGQEAVEGDFDDKKGILVVMLRLAEYGYIGHRLLLLSSRQIAMVLERLQCMDPFDEGFSQTYENLFFMFHVVETLVAAHITAWKEENNFSLGILEEWVTCHFHCRTMLEKRPTAWTPQFMIVLDSITDKLLEQLHSSSELEGHNGKDIWKKALVHLLASAASAVKRI